MKKIIYIFLNLIDLFKIILKCRDFRNVLMINISFEDLFWKKI